MRPLSEKERQSLIGVLSSDDVALIDGAATGFFEEKIAEPIMQMSGVLESLAHRLTLEPQRDFFSAIEAATKEGTLPPEIASGMHLVRVFSNKVRHNSLAVNLILEDTRNCLSIGRRTLTWFLVESQAGPSLDLEDAGDPVFHSPGRLGFDDILTDTVEVLRQDPWRSRVLRVLLLRSEPTVDELTRELGAARPVLLPAIGALMKAGLVQWAEEGSDEITLDQTNFNTRHLVNRALDLA